tara:strand:- start:22793 stop:23791 length:999 start_codon:yes stop_codon:yes gene_type:complete
MRNNILVLNNHGLGDVVMSFSFFENLLANDSKSKILVLFKSNLEKELFTLTLVYQENQGRFKLFSMNEIKKLFFYMFRIKKAYALGINEAKSKKLFKILGIKKYYLAHPYEYTKSKSTNVLHNETILHKSVLYSNLLNISNECSLNSVSKDFFIDIGSVNDIGKYVVLTGGSGELEKHKRWTTLGYRELLEEIIANTEYKIVFVGASGEQQIVDEILLDIEYKYLENIIQLNGKTNLKELINILRNSNLVVGNDNGVLHIASACNVKILGLFGSTDYMITGPNGNNITIIDNRIECAPCYSKKGKIKGCEDNICMKDISSEQVYKKIMEILK